MRLKLAALLVVTVIATPVVASETFSQLEPFASVTLEKESISILTEGALATLRRDSLSWAGDPVGALANLRLISEGVEDSKRGHVFRLLASRIEINATDGTWSVNDIDDTDPERPEPTEPTPPKPRNPTPCLQWCDVIKSRGDRECTRFPAGSSHRFDCEILVINAWLECALICIGGAYTSPPIETHPGLGAPVDPYSEESIFEDGN